MSEGAQRNRAPEDPPPCRAGSDSPRQRRLAARDEALPPQAPIRPGRAPETERAPEPRGRVEADARLRPRRLRQDDAPGRVAGSRSRRWPVGGVAFPRPGDDNQPASFWTYLVSRVADGGAGVGARALPLLQGPQPPPIETVLTTLLNELSALPNDVVLVLDDFHVIDTPTIHDADGLPARAPALQAAPGDRHPRRSGAAARPPAGPGCRAASRSVRPICGSRREEAPPTSPT